MRIKAQLHKFNVHGSTTQLSEVVSAIFFLNNTNVYNEQRVSILASSAPSNAGLTPPSSTDEFIAAVCYEVVASVVFLCDIATSCTQHALTAMTAQTIVTESPKPRSDRARGLRNNVGSNPQ